MSAVVKVGAVKPKKRVLEVGNWWIHQAGRKVGAVAAHGKVKPRGPASSQGGQPAGRPPWL